MSTQDLAVGFRRREFGPTFRRDQLINAEHLRLPMKHEIKSLCQQILKHFFELAERDPTLCLRKNIVAFGLQRVQSGDSIKRNAVRPLYALTQIDVTHRKAVRSELNFGAVTSLASGLRGRVGSDRRDFERGSVGGRQGLGPTRRCASYCGIPSKGRFN